MFPTYAIALIGLSAWWLYSNITGLSKNVAAAKRSGLPWYIVPINIYNIAWLMTFKIWMPLLQRLPKNWTESWLIYLLPDWVWIHLYDAVKPKGDLFLTVSPGAIQVWATNAEAIHQITSRRESFPKPIGPYKILNTFGLNIITTEGSDWKKHRRICAPGFNEKNNALVFQEAKHQAQEMLRKWTGEDGSGNVTLTEVPTDTMRLTLYIISTIGFGVKLLWPGEKQPGEQSAEDAIYSSNVPAPNHTMSFEKSLSTLVNHMKWVLLTPTWLLKRLPIKSAQVAYESFVNWGQYMNELLAQKIIDTREGQKAVGMDIMGSLVKSSYGDSKRAERGSKPVLTDAEVLGNAFVIIVAGHETTANAVHFSLMELAMDPRSQRAVQKEVQSIFGDEPPEKWDYDSNINALLGGFIGAVLNEELRLLPPITAIPKYVPPGQDQALNIDGKKVYLPAGAHINLNTIGVQRNPKYWPTRPSRITDRPDDLNDFRPERWLMNAKADGKQIVNTVEAEEDKDEFGGFTGHDSHANLFRPVKGSYLPFSEGPRSCIGRRLAQVEVMSALSVIFQRHSIELAVDQWASDEEVAEMSDDEKRILYKKAQEAGRATLRTATSMITLKLHPGHIPVRVVRKGEERFIHLVD